MKKNLENLRSSASQKGFTPLKKSGGEVSGEIKLFRTPFQRNLFRKSSSLTGFTLLEVLVALVILSIGLLGLASLTTIVIKTNSYSDDFTTATILAQDELEQKVNLDYGHTDLNDGTTADGSPVDESGNTGNHGSKFTRTTTVDEIDTGNKKRITVRVTWTNSAGYSKGVTVETIKSS